MPATSPLTRLWYRWKALRLPWRRQFLAGHDLAGNTFWEFKDALNANRMRRIVKYSGVAHYADVQISPQWHQWLRHTRPAAPTIQEQQYEVARRARMLQLAADADERWKSQLSYLDSPNKQQAQPALELKDPGGYTTDATNNPGQSGVRSAIAEEAEMKPVPQKKKLDSKRQNAPTQGAPGETWQPESWSGGITPRR